MVNKLGRINLVFFDAVILKGDSGFVWGAGFKPLDNVKNNLIISIGHKIDLETCLIIVRRLCKFRIPEPVSLY